jgi:ribosomal protein S6--L-glutamate ligase
MVIHLLTLNQNLYSSRRLIEAAKYRGHNITPVDYSQCKLLIETDTTGILYGGYELQRPDVVIPRIGASNTFYGSTVIRQFELEGIYSLVSSEGLLSSRDKFRSLQILAKNGINIPKTGFASSGHHSKELIEDLGGTPIIVKLLEGTQGLGVLKLDSKNGAESTLDALSQLKAKVILQEYIKESSGEDIRAIVVGDKVVAAMKRKAPEGEFRSNIHRGGVGDNYSLSDSEIKMAVDAAKALGLEVAGVDMLMSAKGAQVIEINSSPGLEGIELYTKVNVAQEIIKHIESKFKK